MESIPLDQANDAESGYLIKTDLVVNCDYIQLIN